MLPPLWMLSPFPTRWRVRAYRGGTCRISGVGWLNHASISGSAGSTMRQFRDRSARACVYFGVGGLNHASIPGSVGSTMRQFRDRSARACVDSGAG